MRKFALLFRMDLSIIPSAQQMEAYMHQWTTWINSIADKNQLAEGNHLSRDGKVLRSSNESDGPYEVQKESIAGYIVICAENMEGALETGRKCPILNGEGTSVEIREVASAG